MSEYSLINLYERGTFISREARQADEAIARLLQFFSNWRNDAGLASEFEHEWQEFLRILLAEFPTITSYNLAQLGLPLRARELNQENLIVLRLCVELCPQSSEHHCFLGHAYRKMGDFEAASRHYKQAYDLTTERLDKAAQMRLGHPEYLDAASYLYYLADAQNELRHYGDALVNGTRALSMITAAPGKFDESMACEVLYRTCIGLRSPELAEHYRALMIRARSKEE